MCVKITFLLYFYLKICPELARSAEEKEEEEMEIEE